MKMRMLCIFAAAAMLASAPACSPKTHVGGPETDDPHGQAQTTPGENGNGGNGNSENENRQEDDNMIVSIYIGDKKFEAEIEDSETGRAFMDKLPLDLDMKELNGNEKYCYGVPLPQDAKHCPSIEAGDLMLYGKDCIVLFYAPAGGYSYTRIGRLKSVSGLKEAVGSSDVCVKFRI